MYIVQLHRTLCGGDSSFELVAACCLDSGHYIMKVTEFQLELEPGGVTDTCQVVHVCMLEVQCRDSSAVT
jgi:hypothetical protein